MKRIKSRIANLKYRHYIERCYSKQEYNNSAIFDLCKGKPSNNPLTYYTDEGCLSCKYYFNPNKGENRL